MPCYAAAFGQTLVTAEITGGFMVLADYLRTKMVVPLQEKLRNEGRSAERVEVNKHWRAWNGRRQEAEARGESFEEPEPYSDHE